MAIKQIIDLANANPRKLFQIDGFGAILSAILLGILLPQMESIVGIPKPTLFFLAYIPCLLSFFDFYNHYKKIEKSRVFLRAISIANVLYCLLSIELAFYHRKAITTYGWIYIFVDIVIISLLVFVELNDAIVKPLNKSEVGQLSRLNEVRCLLLSTR